MPQPTTRRALLTAAASLALLAPAGVASAADAKTATSASDFGGMDGLIAAAK